MPDFVHLHCHTHYSMLASPILPEELFADCLAKGMNAVAVTDHASLFNMPQLFAEAQKASEKNGKPFKLIVGAELFIAPESRHKKDSREAHHLNVLVKDATGYRNLCKILSAAAREGFYFRPRADFELLSRFREGLICLTSCEKGELPKLVAKGDRESAERFVRDHKELFGDDFYIELEYHRIDSEARINRELVALAKKFDVKLVATNDVHYLNRKDAPKQEIMLAMKGKHRLSDAKRMRFPNDEFYLKTPDEMAQLFDNAHDELSNSLEIAEKCVYAFKDEQPKLPHFPIPPEFPNATAYLRHLAYQGAKRVYGDLDSLGKRGEEIKSRIEFELSTIARMGYDSYFLIVSDLIEASRKMGYSVGPGRGSAAGSIVAYLTGITQIDPLQYNLLFERFLNPERVTMPDIDIDFTPVGKQKVLDYTIEKYGAESVSKIVAISTLGAKAVIKDVGRVLELPIETVNSITKLVPSKPAGASLSDFINGNPKLGIEPVKDLKDLLKSNDPAIRKAMECALELEGRARNVSVHAAGVVITNGAVDDYVPLYVSDKVETEERRYADEADDFETDDEDEKKDEKQVVTQFDKDWIEKAGLLKIDYLGLETLAVIDETLRLIEKRYGVKLNLQEIPMDDRKTFKIFQDGKMAGIFQFESSGMQSYMMQLQPTTIEDIIAMSALYRPGPMQFIPDYINRKHGKEPVVYPHPLLEPILNYTYGIMVYQEQIMQTAQILGGYTLGGADLLRRAMGKKDKEKMAKERSKFVEGAARLHGIPKEKAEEIFSIMEKFAEYGFNRSHSAAYGVLAYQTAYLKAHYAAEFMCAILNSEADDKERVKILADEAKSMGVKILPPSVNKSDALFTVEDLSNGAKAIRVGLIAIKGVGSAAKEIALTRRRRKKPFKNFFEFCASVDLRLVNKRVLESLIEAGAFDDVNPDRASLYASVEKAIEFGRKTNKSATTGQEGFFADEQFSGGEELTYPELTRAEAWSDAEKLQREKNLVGFYLSNHPLEKHRRDWQAFATLKLGKKICEPKRLYKLIGVIVETKFVFTKKGDKMMFGVLEDFEGKCDFTVFPKTLEAYEKELQKDSVVMLIAEADERDGKLNLLVSEAMPMRKVRERFAQKVVLKLDASDSDALEKLAAVRAICEKNRGGTPIDFELAVEIDGKRRELRLFARKLTIDADDEALDALESVIGAEAVRLSA
ncbi:MAG: DNA polymerase III subunit alpha [Chloroherpetonaceae bacterium]|nr:DNA polymerase III subunit alpha [Chloroherpetonaceae bacterium]MDW8437935.1 DNA polymerase III subunit alpha [Chloroherpetonaceae bacterium]